MLRLRTSLLPIVVFALLLPATESDALLLLDVEGQGAMAVVAEDATFEVGIFAQGLPTGSDGNGLFGFGFEIGFDDGVFSAASPVLQPVWTGQQASTIGASHVGATANRAGETCGPFGSNCSLGSGSVLLATVELTALMVGAHALSLTHFTAPGDNVLFDLTVLDADPGFFQGASILVVPEPSAVLLLLSLVFPAAARGSRP